MIARDYSSHNSSGHILEVDRNKTRLQLTLTSPWGDTICTEFEIAEAEEIAHSIARVCREIRDGLS